MDLSLRQYACRALLSTAKYWTRRSSHEHPAAILRTVALLSKMRPQMDFDLSFLHVSVHLMDDSWAAFSSSSPSVITSAMENVTRITVRMDMCHGPFADDDPGPEEDLIVDTAASHWCKLLKAAKRLTSLDIRGWCDGFTRFLSVLLSDAHWPHLQLLQLQVGFAWWVTSDREGMNHLRRLYETQVLTNFLYRHRETLQDLSLESAIGIDESANRPSGAMLRQAINYLKLHMKSLNKATIVERLNVAEEADFANGPPNDGHVFQERDRARAGETDLGRLAKELHIRPKEMIWPDDFEDDLLLYSMRRNSAGYERLEFEYDFGPYVLGKAAEDDPEAPV